MAEPGEPAPQLNLAPQQNVAPQQVVAPQLVLNNAKGYASEVLAVHRRVGTNGQKTTHSGCGLAHALGTNCVTPLELWDILLKRELSELMDSRSCYVAKCPHAVSTNILTLRIIHLEVKDPRLRENSNAS